ncbi:hypothetical protein THAOC_02494, partial [Thalassiosira oceanica]
MPASLNPDRELKPSAKSARRLEMVELVRQACAANITFPLLLRSAPQYRTPHPWHPYYPAARYDAACGP